MKKIITLFFVLLPFTVYCQEKSMNVTSDSTVTVKNSTVEKENSMEFVVLGGAGTYMMTSLIDMQNSLVKTNSLPVVKTTSFPPYINYSFRLGYKMDASFIGFTGGLMSTGARSSLSDYSGFVLSDINCAAMNLGFYYSQKLKTSMFLNKPLETGYLLNLSYIYSSVKVKDELRLYNTSGSDLHQMDESTINSMGLCAEALVYVKYMINPHFGLELNAGGALNANNPLYYKERKYVVEIFSKKRYANWSGLRASIGLVTMF